jgi:hypothetical protein
MAEVLPEGLPEGKEFISLLGSRLRAWNIILAILYAAVGLGLALALQNSPKSQRYVKQYRGSLPKTTVLNICAVDEVQELENTGLRDPANFISVVFALSSAAHVFYSISPKYLQEVLIGQWSPFRWAEWASSAAIITYLSAILTGEKQENSSLLIGASAGSGYLVFPLIELAIRNGKEGAAYALLCSTLLLAVAWFTLLRSNIALFLDASNANTPQNRPNYMNTLLLSQWFTAVLLLSIQAKHVFSKKGGNYAKQEFQYLGLTTLSKLSFAAIMFWALCIHKKGC